MSVNPDSESGVESEEDWCALDRRATVLRQKARANKVAKAIWNHPHLADIAWDKLKACGMTEKQLLKQASRKETK